MKVRKFPPLPLLCVKRAIKFSDCKAGSEGVLSEEGLGQNCRGAYKKHLSKRKHIFPSASKIWGIGVSLAVF